MNGFLAVSCASERSAIPITVIAPIMIRMPVMSIIPPSPLDESFREIKYAINGKMTLKEEYQKKIDLVNKLLKDRKSTGKSDVTTAEYEHMRDVYQYRIDAMNRIEEKRKKDQVNNYEEMISQTASRRGTLCENCGNTLKSTAKFCGSCGNQV